MATLVKHQAAQEEAAAVDGWSGAQLVFSKPEWVRMNRQGRFSGGGLLEEGASVRVCIRIRGWDGTVRSFSERTCLLYETAVVQHLGSNWDKLIIIDQAIMVCVGCVHELCNLLFGQGEVAQPEHPSQLI